MFSMTRPASIAHLLHPASIADHGRVAATSESRPARHAFLFLERSDSRKVRRKTSGFRPTGNGVPWLLPCDGVRGARGVHHRAELVHPQLKEHMTGAQSMPYTLLGA